MEGAYAFASTKRFVIERELGHGGMGVVYQALDLERNALVALKALTQRDAVNIYRLKNEFRQLADLSHPNLVTLHELCNEGNSWFFTMELVNGKSFDAYVADDRPSTLPPDRSKRETAATRIVRDVSITLSQRAIGSEFPLPRVTCNLKRLRHALRQLVEAVAALHDAGKLHRDIKPSNVLVTAEGRVVVLDFGLVSNTTFIDPESQDAERTVGGCMFGTPAYMSPEQAAGEAVTMASDWYAVGTMLYEALAGQLPFDGSVLEILRQKEEGEPVPPSDVVKGVPDDLDQLCRDLLRRDPSRRPPGAEILRYLTGQSAPPPVLDAQSSSVVRKYGELFVGRERHLAELRAAFEQCKSGKPITVLVHGFSGMGKSALVRCFANDLIRNDEAVVLRGRCYERETVPYKAFDNIIDALSRYMMRLPADEAAELLPRNIHALAVLFPVLRRVKAIAQARRPKQQTADARELRNQAFAALKDLLLRITDFHPLVVNIDDLQWADMDSARMLAFLMGPPDPPPLLLVGAYRRDEAENSIFLRQIIGEQSLSEGQAEVRELAVDALAPDEALRLSSALLRDLPGANALCSNAIAAEAEGVPFFIAELVQHLKAHSDGGALPLSMQPVSLEEVILGRVAGMPPDARRLLHVLSVAANPLEQGVAIDAAGLPHGDRAATLALRAARLIRTRGTRQRDTAETYHDRVRETVARSLDPASMRDIHARIAQAMERHDVSDPERLVVHYSGAGNGVRAGETALQAAHAAAAKLAFNRAADLFKKAIDFSPQHDPSLRALHRHLGDALANAGRGAQAAEAYLKAADGIGAAEARVLQRVAAQQYLRSGRIAEGSALARELLDRAGIAYPSSAPRAIAQVLLERGRLALTSTSSTAHVNTRASASLLERLDVLSAVSNEILLIDPLVGTVLQTRFLREALAAGEPTRLMQALAWEALNTAVTGGDSRRRRVEQLLHRAEDLAQRLARPYTSATALLARAGCNFSRGAFPGCEAWAGEAEAIFRNECTGTSWETTVARTWRYSAIELGGDLSTLRREAPAYELDAKEKGDDYSMGYLTLVVPMAQMMKDDVSAALTHLERQAARLVGNFGTFHLWVMDRTTDALIYSNDGPRAWEYLSSQWPRFERSFLFGTHLFRVNGYFLLGRAAVAALRKGANPTAFGAARRAVRQLRKFSRPDALGYASLVAAAIARGVDEHTAAERELRNAIASFEAAGMRNFALYAKRSLATLMPTDSARQLTSEVDTALRAMDVERPDRWSGAYAPGFD